MRVFDRCTSNNSSSTYILLLWISIYIFIWLVYYFFHDWISTCEYDYRHPNLCSSKSMFIISSLPCFIGSLSFPQPFLDKDELAENSTVLFASGNACLWNCSERRLLQHVWNNPSAVQRWFFTRKIWRTVWKFGRLLVAFVGLRLKNLDPMALARAAVWCWAVVVCLFDRWQKRSGSSSVWSKLLWSSCLLSISIFPQVTTSFSLVWFDGIFRYN